MYFFHATFRVLACPLKNKHLNFRLFQGKIQIIEDQIIKKPKEDLRYEVDCQWKKYVITVYMISKHLDT